MSLFYKYTLLFSEYECPKGGSRGDEVTTYCPNEIESAFKKVKDSKRLEDWALSNDFFGKIDKFKKSFSALFPQYDDYTLWVVYTTNDSKGYDIELVLKKLSLEKLPEDYEFVEMYAQGKVNDGKNYT